VLSVVLTAVLIIVYSSSASTSSDGSVVSVVIKSGSPLHSYQ
jgi:hypothetical protein